MIAKDLGTHPEGLGEPWQGFMLWNQNEICGLYRAAFRREMVVVGGELGGESPR